MEAYQLVRDPRFLVFLGSFYATATTIDMTIDMAIGRFLGVSDEAAQMMTAGMMFGSKIRVLRELVRESDHSKKAAILTQLNKVQNESNRNAFTHSYLVNQGESVFFVERTSGGTYEVREHGYDLGAFAGHVKGFAEAGMKLWDALGYSNDELQAFGKAAVRAVKKSKKPGRPSRGDPKA
jgi:hypothetical protein